MALQTFTDTTFQQSVLEASANKTVIVDFWAPWCGPCRLVGPTIEEVAQRLEGTTDVGKLNVDENPEVARAYNITSIPTVLMFRDGQVVKKMVGVSSVDEYINASEEIAKAA